MSLACLTWVLQHSEATHGRRLVLIALADKAHDDGSRSFPSVETIMLQARMSRRAVQEALRRLERDGHIRRVGQSPFGTRIYSVVMGGAESAPPVKGAESRALGAQNLAKKVRKSAPDPSVTTTERSVGSARAPELALDQELELPDGQTASNVYERLFALAKRRSLAHKAFPTRKGVRAALERHADKDVGRTVGELEFWVEHGNGKHEAIKSLDGRLETFLRRADKAPAAAANGGGKYDRIVN